ncbi:MAG TPA: GNAT family N-acetyltransferase [Burkholderiaceae bacterium]|nr:GNAT family N-acetyltransferase [Burkholderiaceae bacterium]
MRPAPRPGIDATLLSRIEDAGLNASAPPQQRWVDGWLVRFSPGKAKRARCVNAVAVGRMPLRERLQVCAEVFAGANLPMIVRITPFTQPPDLDRQLRTRGLQRFDDTVVMVLPDVPAAEPGMPAGTRFASLGLEAFAHRVGGFRGSPLAQQQAHAERLLNAPVPFSAFELRVDGEAVCCGQYALEGDIVGLYDVFTLPAARGRGFAALLCRNLLARARSAGAQHAYLQVELDNHAARSVYRQLGFVDGYRYHYRALDPASA